jgi:hypothetical protein
LNTVGPIEGNEMGTDAFVSKLNPAGSALLYSTYLGGDGDDDAYAIAVDSSGAAYVAGDTDSSDFNTMGPIEGHQVDADAFVSKLTATGSALTYSTYLGGDNYDVAQGITVDSSGAAYVAGKTFSTDFNTMAPIEPDTVGSADAFVSKLTAAGSALTYSTYLGGASDDGANAITVDSSGAAYVAGGTLSTDFNTVGEIETDGTSTDAFIAKLTAAGSALTYSTYLGGDGADRALAIALDSTGAAYVAGDTDSTDFNTLGPIESDGGDADYDAFISKLVDDSAQPNSTISRVRVRSRRRRATVTFSGTDAVSSPSELEFECKLDRRAFAPCNSPKTYRKLKPGRHTVKVRATDEVGNLETSPATRRFRVRRR